MTRTRPTIETVAARAGVGRGTASRVVNGSSQVSAAARAAVLKAVEELGYVPNRAARNLVTRRTDCVALVISEPGERLFSEPYFAGIVRGISTAMAQTQLQLWLSMVQSSIERDRAARFLSREHVDGVLMLSQHADDPLPARVRENGLPLVLCGQPLGEGEQRPEGGDIPFVDADNATGARQAAQYLLDQGRRRIASIAGPQDMSAGVARLQGFRQLAGDELVEYGDFSEDSGAKAMAALLDREPALDAVFAASDPMAFGAMRVLKASGRRIPEDVAVIGFDGSPAGRNSDPPLTSVFQPTEEMGREMTRLLLAQLGGDEPTESHVIVDTQLELRGSA
ncbi:transcriptional regulator, LacI family [Kribbella flavida DSM 17836]|uniref:Transcriptional regulator, LacI family n=1 Tax=Kribbella flavida (strain DSM 17836 / JCM 10339 / NBRC 14399) TaxID=479435 RepID=D2PL16_KRIFD|nr:LacI family DNA-binding transcriptional regulator [Kribbella flavida]ADB34271.1 transcriptional regulator, LacI family [Kribbella flavida DSM 17836]